MRRDNAFGLDGVLSRIDFYGCGVGRGWLIGWWKEHQRKDAARKEMDAASKEAARKQAILDSGDYKRLGAMIKHPRDIEATVSALRAQVPAGCDTIAPPNPTASGILTTYFGDVRVVEAFDPIKGLVVMRADLYYREKQPVKVAADSKGLAKAAEGLGDLVKQMATDVAEVKMAAAADERVRCANIATLFADEAWRIYRGHAPERDGMKRYDPYV